MKALEILKHQLGIYSNSTMRLLVTEHPEAIAELEALQATKSCDGCVNEMYYGLEYCTNCSRAKFVWDNYEPKEAK
jgi:hypothetical protein